MSARPLNTHRRNYRIDPKWFLTSLVALTIFVAGCHGGGGGGAGKPLLHTATVTVTATAASRTPTSTSTPSKTGTATQTATVVPTATQTATAAPTTTRTATSTGTSGATPTATSSASRTATPTPTPPGSSQLVASTNPSGSGCGASGVPTNRKVTVTFNQAIKPSTLTMSSFTVTGPGTTPVSGNISYDPTNDVAIFAPVSPLPPSTTFTGMITTAVQSVSGGSLPSNFVWMFQSSADSETVKPTVISTSPANLAPSAPTNQKISATFSDPMDSSTISGSTFTLTGPGLTPVMGSVTYSTVGAAATFTPNSALAPGVLFTAMITTGVTDLAGNPIATAYSWTFTAGSGPDVVAPSLTLQMPANGAMAVPLNAGVNVTFSKAMDPATLNGQTFTLTGPGATPVAGKITYDATDLIATFTPTSVLASGSTYSAAITNGAKDLEGNGLTSNFSWNFMTGSASGLTPIDLGAASGFQVVAQASITNNGMSMITGDIGLTPGSAVGGFPPGVVNGTIQIDNAPAIAALAAVMNAFTTSRPNPITAPENLATQVLPPGLYQSAATSLEITGGNLTLDGQGDANAIWIFQMPASTLTLTTPGCDVDLINGAQFSNVYWEVGSSATVGSGCVLQGNVIANTSITMVSGSALHGRAFGGAVAPSGAVTLDTDTMSAAGGCNQ